MLFPLLVIILPPITFHSPLVHPSSTLYVSVLPSHTTDAQLICTDYAHVYTPLPQEVPFP